MYLKQVLDKSNRGWLTLKDQNITLLPYTTQVKVLGRDHNFEKVQIIEGDKKGLVLNVPYALKDNSEYYSYFSEQPLHASKLVIVVEKKDKKIIIDNIVYDIEISDELKSGDYFLKLPIKNTKIPKEYINESHSGSRFAESWFPLIRKDDFDLTKYLHYGTFSKGCLTVKHKNDKTSVWSDIYMKVIHSRLNDIYLAKLIIE